MLLKMPIEKTINTTKDRIRKLHSMGIFTVYDLLMYFPNRYDDVSTQKNIFDIQHGDISTLHGTISEIYEELSPKQQKKIIKAILKDDQSNVVEIVWFNQTYLLNKFKEGDRVSVSGKIQETGFNNFTMISPRIEKISNNNIHTGRLVPIYPESEPINSSWLREKIYPLLYIADEFEENLPIQIIQKEKFIKKSEAIKQIHFPTSISDLNEAKRRLSFEELFEIQLKALKMQLEIKKIPNEKKKIMLLNSDFINEIKNILPWKLTDDQRIAIYEILKDMEKDYPMYRLLEGDVGSGKTVVAFICMLHVMVLYDYQCVFMAPTEILAQQHMRNFNDLLEKIYTLNDKFNNIKNIKTTLLIGSMPAKLKKETQQKIINGQYNIIIGTHALIQENIKYKKLGFVVIDEQHRFGVEQRDFFKQFDYPHVLHMTATPIPRTLALTIYGHQDISIISQKPAGRKEIITKIVTSKNRPEIYNFCKDQIKKGRQIFVICPLINDSEMLEAKSVINEYENLRSIFTDAKIAMVHGKMKEKDQIMQDFKNKLYDILVSTSVIEVGVDIPNATIMIIEGAERFGLSQLHQFRGRIGRNNLQSYCFLFTSDESMVNITRLKAMEKTNNGFELAKIDLQLRGPGEVFGLRQAGIPDFKLANWNDIDNIKKARDWAYKVLIAE